MINVETFGDGDTYKRCLKKYKMNVANVFHSIFISKKKRKEKESEVSELLCKVKHFDIF